MKKLLLGLSVVAALVGSLLTATPALAAPIHPTGSFLQPGYTTTWTYSDWYSELGYLKAAGNSLLILQWTADAKTKTTIYPTSIAGYTQDPAYTGDPIANLLSAADAQGMTVWLGSAETNDWYTKHANDLTWLNNLFADSRSVEGELYSRYSSHPSLTGFYESNEMDNCNFQSSAAISNMASVLSANANYVHGLSASLKYSAAPALWPESWCGQTGQTYSQNSAAWSSTWNGILNSAALDYLMPQDGLGGHFHTNSEIVTWFNFIKSAIASHTSTQLWADIETFNVTNTSPWFAEPMSIADMVAHTAQLSGIVSGLVTFSYDHFQSPNLAPGKTTFYHTTYLNYLATGTVESSPPTTPLGLTSPKQGPTSVALAWSASTDDVGAMYYVLRNGQIVGRTNTPSFQDQGPLTPSTSYTYTVVAFDAAGNQSSPSSALNVATSAQAIELAAGRPYTVSMPASASYPDTGGALTDGQFATTDYSDSRWQGRWFSTGGGNYTETVDLGGLHRVDQISQDFLYSTVPGVLLPSVSFSTSQDGTTFVSQGPAQTSGYSGVADPSSVKLSLITSGQVTARYVKVSVSGVPASWVFTDELQVEQFPVDLALGKSYSASVPPGATYPDTANRELTDGVLGTSSYQNAAWQGRADVPTYSITIDLGTVASASEFNSRHLRDDSSGIALPSSVTVSTSTDGATFTTQGSLTGNTSTSPATSDWALVLSTPVSARYVKFTITGTQWSFIDELRVIQ